MAYEGFQWIFTYGTITKPMGHDYSLRLSGSITTIGSRYFEF
jgi:hypothetical protein